MANKLHCLSQVDATATLTIRVPVTTRKLHAEVNKLCIIFLRKRNCT